MEAAAARAKPVKITKSVVDATRPQAREVRVWDSELKGFVLRVLSSGCKTYAVKYRIGPKQRWFTIGEHGSPWTPDKARDKAREVIFKARQGEDLQADKVERRNAVTISQVIDLYLEQGPSDRPNKRESSWARDRMDLNNHVRPLVGDIAIKDLKPSHVSRMQADVVAGKTAKNVKGGFRTRYIVKGGAGAGARSVATLSAMLSWAIRRDFIADNACLRVTKRQARFHARFLSEAETERLLATCASMEGAGALSHEAADIIRLLIYTGARRREISDLRWSEVSFERRILILPPERTKAGGRNRYRTIPLSPTAIALLQRRRQLGVCVFPMPSADKPIQNLYDVWQRVKKEAKLDDVRLHDLRHTFASTALAAGAPLASVGRALGHSNASSTQRYAHLRDESALAVADLVDAVIGRRKDER
jgi:integrase